MFIKKEVQNYQNKEQQETKRMWRQGTDKNNQGPKENKYFEDAHSTETVKKTETKTIEMSHHH